MVALRKEDEQYVTLKKELRKLLDKHTSVAELLNGQKDVNLTAEEQEAFHEYMVIRAEIEHREREFLSKIIDRDAITEPFALAEKEVKLLAEFLAIISDKREIEEMKMYVMGCRDAYRLLRGMNIIE